MLCSTSERASLFSVFFYHFIQLYRNRSFNHACGTTRVEDTYRTLTAIPFKVGENNSSKIFVIVSIREKICRVYVPVYLRYLGVSNIDSGNCAHMSVFAVTIALAVFLFMQVSNEALIIKSFHDEIVSVNNHYGAIDLVSYNNPF